MASQSDDIMSIEQLAEYLQVSQSTLYVLAREGRLPGQKVGKRWRFHKGAINDWLSQKGSDEDGNPRAKDEK